MYYFEPPKNINVLLEEKRASFFLTLYYLTHFVGFVEVLQLRGRWDDGSSGPGIVVAVGGDVVGDGGGGVAAVLHLAPVSRLPSLEPCLERGEVCFP